MFRVEAAPAPHRAYQSTVAGGLASGTADRAAVIGSGRGRGGRRGGGNSPGGRRRVRGLQLSRSIDITIRPLQAAGDSVWSSRRREPSVVRRPMAAPECPISCAHARLAGRPMFSISPSHHRRRWLPSYISWPPRRPRPRPRRFSLAPAATLPGYVVSPSSARETAGSDDEAAGGGRHAPRSMVHAARDVTALCRQQQLSQGRGPDSQPSTRRFEPGRNLHDGPGCALCLARGPRIGPTDLISFDTIHRRR